MMTHKVTPAHEPHEQLLEDVNEWLEAQGFGTASFTYHEILREENERLADRIGEMRDPTAITMRHRADRIAVHWELPVAFWWEAKTKSKGKERNPPKTEKLYIDECTIISTYSRDPELKTLFIHRNQYSNLEVGFWAHDVPKLMDGAVRIAHWKWGDHRIVDWYMRQARYIFGQDTRHLDHTGGGTGDPYIVIPHRRVVELPHWQVAIEEAVEEAKLREQSEQRVLEGMV